MQTRKLNITKLKGIIEILGIFFYAKHYFYIKILSVVPKTIFLFIHKKLYDSLFVFILYWFIFFFAYGFMLKLIFKSGRKGLIQCNINNK